MTLRELRYLVALADRAHFGRAAEDCHVSQPTLSTQIRKLEEYLGATLIERNTKSISLTPLGQQVAEQARQIVSRVDALLVSARAAREPLAGPLQLGLIPTLAPYFLPWFIPQVKFRYPRLDLEKLPLFDEPFWFACPPQHPLARCKAVTETDLRDEPLLLLADGHCLRGQALAACGRQGADDDGLDDFRAASLETICQLVAAGLGCTLLPALATRLLSGTEPRFAILPMHATGASRRIGLVWRRGYPKAEELSLLAGLVREQPPEGTHTVLMDEKSLRSRRH